MDFIVYIFVLDGKLRTIYKQELHNSLDDFLMDLSLKKNDLYFLKSQVGDISKLTEYSAEIYFEIEKIPIITLLMILRVT